jgi:hypothetical protein
MDQEGKACLRRCSGNHPLISSHAQWRVSLGNEDVGAALAQ